MFSFFAVLVLMLGSTRPQAQSAPAAAPSGSAAETAKDDPAVTALALKVYQQMRAGKVDTALLSDQMNKALTPDVLAQNKPMFDQLGDPTKLTLEKRNATARGTSYVYLATFATAQFHVTIFITVEGKVGGYLLAP